MLEPFFTPAFIALLELGWGEYLPLVAKIFNILLFVGLMIYILRRPIGDAFRGKRESIRRELMRAQEERNAALAKLEEVEGRLARLDAEIEAVRAQAQKEAADERARIERATEEEIRKLREQARREIENTGKVARAELQAFAAEQSIRLAEEMIRQNINSEDDARLVNQYVEELGGARR